MAPGLLLSSFFFFVGGPQPTLESRMVFGSSFCSVKCRGQCQQSLLFFQLLAVVWLGNSFLRPRSPLGLP